MDKIQKQIYAKKRELILSVLESFFGYWDLAPGIHALVSSQFVTPELLDGLIQIMNDALKTVQNDEFRQKIQKGLELIEHIKQIESQERAEDLKLAELELLKL